MQLRLLFVWRRQLFILSVSFPAMFDSINLLSTLLNAHPDKWSHSICRQTSARFLRYVRECKKKLANKKKWRGDKLTAHDSIKASKNLLRDCLFCHSKQVEIACESNFQNKHLTTIPRFPLLPRRLEKSSLKCEIKVIFTMCGKSLNDAACFPRNSAFVSRLVGRTL